MHTKSIMLAALVLLSGCSDDRGRRVVTPSDVTPPAAPRGVYSVTGDHEVFIAWLDNTESDVAGYRIYDSSCSSGPGCPYDLVGVTSASSFTLTGLSNGVTRYYAVAAYDHAGNESDLSYDDVFDTPRPEGFDAFLNNSLETLVSAGWDFSAFTARAADDTQTDIYYGFNGAIHQMFAPDLGTDIQDAGVASSLDAVDYAPIDGWSPSGTVELIEGHCYVVGTRDNHYAKFRVTDIIPASGSDPARVVFDWAYQVDTGNRELRARPVRSGSGVKRPVYWAR
jgi:hypothetical protein